MVDKNEIIIAEIVFKAETILISLICPILDKYIKEQLYVDERELDLLI